MKHYDPMTRTPKAIFSIKITVLGHKVIDLDAI